MQILSTTRHIRSAVRTVTILMMALMAAFAQTSLQNSSAGVTISNRATAAYSDDSGNTYNIVSPTVTLTIRAVAGVRVTPDETQSSAAVIPNERVTRVFQVCNTGNAPDSYVLTRGEALAPSQIISLHFDIDGNGSFDTGDTPITLNATATPVLQPGECLNVLALVDTGAVSPGGTMNIQITARSTSTTAANGVHQDDGTIINNVSEGIKFTAPDNPALPPIKLVENKDRHTTTPGSVLHYTISFRNQSQVIARNVLLTDDLPPEVDYLPGTLKLCTRVLSDIADADEGQVIGRRIEIRFAQLAPDEVITATFEVRLNNAVIAGVGVINTAIVSGDNVRTSVRTSEAVAVINPYGTVYAGYSGGAVRIPGARVVLSSDQQGASPITTSQGIGYDPNSGNVNPFATDGNGNFSFALTPDQFGTIANPATYFINVSANGYRPRLLQVTIQPVGEGLFNINVRGLDGQPIARTGSFELTSEQVNLNNLAAVVMNIPMFEAATLELSKIADRQHAEIGDMISYRVEARNATSVTMSNVEVTDTLPASFTYVPGSARLQIGGAPPFTIEPQINGTRLKFLIGDLPAGERVQISYRVRLGANAREGEQVNIAVAGGTFPNGDKVTTPPAKSPVVVGMGMFSMRQLIIGRVFEDTNGNGLFDKGERPVAGARVYLNNGTYVLTDSQGLYNFPSIEDGAQVVSLDPITVPRGFALHENGLRSGRSWTRLTRTPLNGGGLLRVNFPLAKLTRPGDTTIDIDTGADGDARLPVGGDARLPVGGDARLPVDGDARLPIVPGAPAESEEAGVEADSKTAAKNAGNNRNRKARAADTDQAGFVTDRIKGRRGPKTRAGMKAISNVKAGTYTSVATEVIDPVAPGDIKVLSPEMNEVIMDAALRVEARVALGHEVRLEVEGEQVPDTNIAVREDDKKNKITTIVFVSVNLRPGPNKIKVSAVSPEGQVGRAVELTVMGRGPAKRLEVIADRQEIQSGGRDSTLIRVKAYDEWGNPAAGGQVAIEVSAGRLLRMKNDRPEELREKTSLAAPSISAAGTEETHGITGEQVTANLRQQIVNIENGEGVIQLIAEGQPGEAQIRATSSGIISEGRVRFTPELRPQILVGVAEASFGRAAPDISMRGEDRNVRTHTEFYFRGPLPRQSQLTLAYNSFRPLTRTNGRDRMFALDPLDRVYPVFGDSSTRFEDAQSNTKLFARIDKGRSFAMFGDFDVNQNQSLLSTPQTAVTNLGENLASSGIGNTVLNNFRAPVFAAGGPQLTSYQRRLTGVKMHFENNRGDLFTVSGARPDTAFGRDVFAGSRFGLMQLSHTDLMQGSEVVVLEVRDRRNPDIILSRETLARSVDYNIDSDTGLLYFLRPISTFDYALNLVQVLVTYEYRSVTMSSGVYTARASKNLQRAGLRVGASFINQRQDQYGAYYLGGIDIDKPLPNGGMFQFEWGISNGRQASGGNVFGFGNLLTSTPRENNGMAFRADLNQPLPFAQAMLQASFARSDSDFANPFGATVTPGSQRVNVAVDSKVRKSSLLRVAFTDERNKSETFSNNRETISVGWIESVNDRLRLSLGYDYRNFSDRSGSVLDLLNGTNNNGNSSVGTGSTGNGGSGNSFVSPSAGRSVVSNLITIGAEYQPTKKMQIAVKREQNLGEADPTYPNQTTIASSYQINSLAKIFFTQRLASGSITPISNVEVTGLPLVNSRRETAIGVESAINKYTSLNGRYQIQNGINGTDSFAVIGLMNRLPIRKTLSLDLGYERGMHLAGSGNSFNNASFGFTWTPQENFKSAARYELRDLNGFGNIFTVGAAGKIKENLTSLGRFQLARTDFEGRGNRMLNGAAALAWRPLESDRTALLFSYTHRSLEQRGTSLFAGARDRDDLISSDGLYQPFRRLELYGRFALKFSENGRADIPMASTLTMLYQGRGEFRFARYFDLAGEGRRLWQPSSSSARNAFGAELGFWVMPDLRVGGGYNFTRATEAWGFTGNGANSRKGFYFVISSKLSNMFNLFGTSREGLVDYDEAVQESQPAGESAAPKKKDEE